MNMYTPQCSRPVVGQWIIIFTYVLYIVYVQKLYIVNYYIYVYTAAQPKS
jgi:hypothetical protein